MFSSISIIAVFLMIITIFPKQIWADATTTEITLSFVHDLGDDPECDLLNKNDLPTRFYTIEDISNKKYFCVTESLSYSSNDRYEINNNTQIVSESVR